MGTRHVTCGVSALAALGLLTFIGFLRHGQREIQSTTEWGGVCLTASLHSDARTVPPCAMALHPIPAGDDVSTSIAASQAPTHQPDVHEDGERQKSRNSSLRVPEPELCLSAQAHTKQPDVHDDGERRSSRSFTSEVSGVITIDAPPSLVFAAYDNIERMPEWSPLLDTVKFVDKEARRSEWTLLMPRIMFRFARAAGFGAFIRWTAEHDVEVPRRLSWKSLSGFPNAGEMLFEAVDDQETKTKVTMRMKYSAPVMAKPLVENWFTRRFMQNAVNATMQRFRDIMEKEAAVTAAILKDR